MRFSKNLASTVVHFLTEFRAIILFWINSSKYKSLKYMLGNIQAPQHLSLAEYQWYNRVAQPKLEKCLCKSPYPGSSELVTIYLC